MGTEATIPPFTIIIPRSAVEAGEIDDVLEIFYAFMESPEAILESQDKVDILFEGYDDDLTELYEIPEVRGYVKKLDEVFPFWPFFLSKHTSGFIVAIFCFLPHSLHSSQKKEVFTKMVNSIFRERWFPAMERVGHLAGFSRDQQEEMVARVAKYVSDGPLPVEY